MPPQALDQSEDLTPLGRHLAQLPLDVHVGKMLVIITLFAMYPLLPTPALLSYLLDGRSVSASATVVGAWGSLLPLLLSNAVLGAESC